MENEKLELLKFIGINTGLIGDFIKETTKNPSTDMMYELIKLYQENEEYRNRLEHLMSVETLSLSLLLIELKQKYEPDHL